MNLKKDSNCLVSSISLLNDEDVHSEEDERSEAKQAEKENYHAWEQGKQKEDGERDQLEDEHREQGKQTEDEERDQLGDQQKNSQLEKGNTVTKTTVVV